MVGYSLFFLTWWSEEAGYFSLHLAYWLTCTSIDYKANMLWPEPFLKSLCIVVSLNNIRSAISLTNHAKTVLYCWQEVRGVCSILLTPDLGCNSHKIIHWRGQIKQNMTRNAKTHPWRSQIMCGFGVLNLLLQEVTNLVCVSQFKLRYFSQITYLN